MKKLPFVSLLAALVVAACGGSIGVDPITRGPDAQNAAGNDPAKSGETPAPVAPIGPYSGLVQSNDVSVLYPLPLAGESHDFVRPTEAGTHGALLPKTMFDVVVPGQRLETTTTQHPSGYADLALVSFRLDHCSTRKGKGTCTSEVRGVFQPIYENADTMLDGDTTKGAAASDGALHVMWELPEAELVVMMKQLLTLRSKTHADMTTTRLEPHPILVDEGLGGGFAQGLRSILLEHVGEARIARVTVFDHNMHPDSDGWTFEIFDRSAGTLTKGKIPTIDSEAMTVAGTSALGGPLRDTGTFEFGFQSFADNVAALANQSRPAKGTPQVATDLQPAFDAALRLQNPTLHDAETTNCGNCHLAEGAFLIGKNDYGLTGNAFTAAGGADYVSQRRSVTNLHAFGYLHRQVSIMQRTANESTVVRDWMDQKVK